MTKKNVTLEVDSLKIAGRLYLPNGRPPYPTVCICHGIPSKTIDPKDKGYSPLAERIRRQGLAVFTFNFRGVGDSSGNLDLSGWTRDLKTTINFLCTLPEIDGSRLSILGFSAGAAVSIYVAAQDKRVSSIIACACPAEFNFITEAYEPQSVIDYFRDIGTIRDDEFPYSAEEWLSGFRLISPIEYVAKVAPRPLLLVHGNQDEIVNVSHAYRSYDRAREPKQIIIIDGAGHRLRDNDGAMAIVIDHLKSHIKIN
ncbi:alpha/beta hydrolase [Chloroflexota bacterium]